MTKEEAIKHLETYSTTNGSGQTSQAQHEEAKRMGIKALEQTEVLDKIRAEIMDFEEELFHRPNTDYSDYAAVRHCVEIIDKYKAESEARNDTNSTADL